MNRLWEVDHDSEHCLSIDEVGQLYDRILKANKVDLELCAMQFWAAFRRRALTSYHSRVLSRAIAIRREEIHPPNRRRDRE